MIDLKSKIYLSGPMTGIADLNYPAFNAAAKALRDKGHTVLNPAENPEPDCPPDRKWREFMNMAITQLVQCDVVVFLPDWEKSSGACIEFEIAKSLNIGHYYLRDKFIK